MTEKDETLRLADALGNLEATGHCSDSVSLTDRSEAIADAAAAELRRLHAENASLAAALASSCDEQRHELWESGGVAGCERARAAERQRDALLEALQRLLAAYSVSHSPKHRQSCWDQARAAIKAV